jgi:hypothetical protein
MTNYVMVTNVDSFTNGLITVTMTGHGLVASNQVYLVFTTGGATEGSYRVVSAPDTSHFTVTNAEAVARAGNCLIPKLTGGFTQSGTNVTINIAGSHYLNPGDSVYIVSGVGSVPARVYQVASVVDASHFKVVSPVSGNQAQMTITVFPLVAPPLVRSGAVNLQFSTWNIGMSDNDLTQTPLNSPTVFNYFFPDYKFPGLLASAGLTTPEFQITSDTGVAYQMNFLYNGIIAGGDVNGFTGFRSGNGSIMLDLGPWMTTAYTSNAGIPSLVDALNSLLAGGQVSSTVKTYIVNYANTLGYTTPTPTTTQMRDRVRAVAHMILTSPDFTIQK